MTAEHNILHAEAPTLVIPRNDKTVSLLVDIFCGSLSYSRHTTTRGNKHVGYKGLDREKEREEEEQEEDQEDMRESTHLFMCAVVVEPTSCTHTPPSKTKTPASSYQLLDEYSPPRISLWALATRPPPLPRPPPASKAKPPLCFFISWMKTRPRISS